VPRGIENAIIDFCRSLYGSVGWLGVLIAMAIESAAIPLPSEVIMPLAGWFLIQDKGHPVWYVLIAGIVGALGCVLGSAITYWIGATGGRPLLMRYGKYVFISPHHIDMADTWFAEKGEATAFFSRLLPVVRTFISLPAGIARMNFARFIIYTFAGSFLWCIVLAAGGYYAGSNWEHVRNVMRPFDLPIAALVVIGLVIFFVRGRQAQARAPLDVRE
jgi:membrane protein DedA with SNARE-associated domain